MKRALIFSVLPLLGMQFANATASIDLGNLGSEWATSSNVMDEIWVPLKLTGINYFAYGALVKPRTFAARSDASSPLYQAWFGGYAINGGKEVFDSGVKAKEFEWFSRFAELDQSSWLGAMGDPHPRAKWIQHSKPQTIRIDGQDRTLYIATMVSNSDVSESSDHMTGLAKMIGMPAQLTSAPVPVQPFHSLTIKGLYAFWYDSQRDMVFVVYGVAGSFKDNAGHRHDNYPALAKKFRGLMTQVKIVD